MARDKITDKSNPPKSPWFGYKYRVTPESSKLLQEAVFKDGGGWGYTLGRVVSHTDKPFLVVRQNEITFSDDEYYFENAVYLPEKQPPQPVKKDFVVGKYYKYILTGLGVFKTGKYYKLFKAQGGLLFTEDMYTYMNQRAFDINSELDYDPNTARPAGYTAYVVFKQESTGIGRGTYNGKEYAYKCSREDYTQYREYRAFDEDVFALVNVSGIEKTVKVVRIEAISDPKATKSIVTILPNSVDTGVKESKLDHIVKVTINRDDFFTRETTNYPTTKEEIDMSNQNRVVSVKFFDDDAGLKAEQSLVAEYQITTRVSDAMTVSKVLLTEDVAGDIAAHNEVRAATIDLHILKQTGNKVTLQPIEFEDLRVEVRQV